MIYANTRLIKVDSALKVMMADLSELPEGIFVRLWPDSIDAGIHMLSSKTGKISDWVIEGECRDNEGDLMFWELVPTTASLRAFPALEGWKFKVFND